MHQRFSSDFYPCNLIHNYNHNLFSAVLDNLNSCLPSRFRLLTNFFSQDNECVVNGTHKVTIEEATHLAAIRVQIQFGNHDDSKHKKGFLELPDLLPAEYRKTKDMEKKIFAEHR